MTLDLALAWMTALVMVGAALNAAELLANRRALQPGGAFDWNVLRYASPSFSRSRPLAAVFGAGGFTVLLVVELVAALLAFALAVRGIVHPGPVGVVLAVHLAHTARSGFGLDGADQMSSVVLVAVWLAVLRPEGWVPLAAVAFVAGQSALSYFTAGYFKMVSPVWRSGDALLGVISTKGYGHAGLYGVLRPRPSLTWALSASLLLFECTFPLALFTGELGAAVYVAAGVGFHVGNAVFMGLNNFFWAFVATYPAVLFCAGALWRAAVG